MALTASMPIASNLTLNSLEVKNFRAFRHLTIPKLGRVNLITGKNNVGKSSLLEAILMYALRASPRAFWQILSSRELIGADIAASSTQGIPKDSGLLSAIVYTFHGTSVNDVIYNRVPLSIIMCQVGHADLLNVSLVWPALEKVDDTPVGISTHFTGQFITGHSILYAIHRIRETEVHSYFENKTAVPCRFVPTGTLDKVQVGSLWDEIALSPKKTVVMNALQEIEPDLVDITLKGDNGIGLGRVPYVQLKSQNDVVPLRLLGDGTNRLFGISLALVTAGDGILLVDEISDGLHYLILLEVWRFIFRVAHDLNVQVFATTHSWDCIQAFQQAAEEDEQDEGVLIRLQNKDGDVTATVFDERRLAVVTREQIEVR